MWQILFKALGVKKTCEQGLVLAIMLPCGNDIKINSHDIKCRCMAVFSFPHPVCLEGIPELGEDNWAYCNIKLGFIM